MSRNNIIPTRFDDEELEGLDSKRKWIDVNRSEFIRHAVEVYEER